MNANLVKILTEQTQSLKEQYIEKTKEWAVKSHANATNMANWKETDWCKYFDIEPELKNAGTNNEWMGFPKGFYNTRNARTYSKERNKATSICSQSLDYYLAQEEKDAIRHYENSILKLADRIEAKGLNQSALKVETSHIKYNIETVITDGEKRVRAFTILAWGEVNRPHYRYLVK